jgi:hypothetical protein
MRRLGRDDARNGVIVLHRERTAGEDDRERLEGE